MTLPGGPLVRPLLRRPFRRRDRPPLEPRRAVLPADDRVLQEVHVVAVGIVVRPRMRAAALLAREAGHDHAVGELEQEAELERLREVAVEDLALVLDVDA